MDEPDQISWVGLRDVAAALTDRDAGIFVEAVAIANWHATHTHCPRCGTPTEPVSSGWVRRCPADGSEHFPRTDPAVIVTVTDRDGRVLLGNNAAWAPGRFSTLAGFVEPGSPRRPPWSGRSTRSPPSWSTHPSTWAPSPGRSRSP